MNDPKPLTVTEAAEQTNMSISWWRRMIFERRIKHIKIGRKILIPTEVVEDLLKNSIVNARS